MEVPRLRHVANRAGRRTREHGEAGIVARGDPGTLRHAESRESSFLRTRSFKEGRVRRIGPRIPALDIVEPELVQQFRDDDLVLDRKIDARRLGTVSQGGVEKGDAFFGH